MHKSQFLFYFRFQLKSSGIDASAWKLVKKTKKKTNASSLSKSMPESVLETTEHSESVSHDPTKIRETNGNVTPDEKYVLWGEGRGIVFGFFFVIFLSVVLQVFHLFISSPIAPGSVVPPGHWLSKCGLFGNFNSCENANLHVNKRGTIVYYNSQGEVAWRIDGDVCKLTDDKCIPGVQFTKDKKVIIGGKQVSFVEKFGIDTPLSPWPFEEPPKLKTRLSKKQR